MDAEFFFVLTFRLFLHESVKWPSCRFPFYENILFVMLDVENGVIG